MADRDLISIAEQFNGLPMRDLIGVPLMAAAEANSAMAVTQTQFLLDTAFKKVGDDGSESYEPILIKMSLRKSFITPPAEGAGPDDKGTITEQTITFELPILTILPLNSLAVDEVDIKFHMEVKSTFSETTSEKSTEEFGAAASWSAKAKFGPFSASAKGNVSYKSTNEQSDETYYEKSNSAQYDVHVHAGQLPLPPGVATILKAYTNAISANPDTASPAP